MKPSGWAEEQTAIRPYIVRTPMGKLITNRREALMTLSSRAAGATTPVPGVLAANCGEAADNTADDAIRSFSSLPSNYVNPAAARGPALVADHRSVWRSA